MKIEYWTYFFYSLFILLTIVSANAFVTYKKDSNNAWAIDMSKPGVYLFLFSYSFIIGLRYMVGRDYFGYLNWFKELKATGVFPVDNEIGFVFLNKIIASSGLHFSFLFITIAFLQIFFIMKSTENISFLRSWFFFFFFTSLMFFVSMNVMRQTIAFFIFFYSLNLFLSKRYGLTFLLFLLAMSFHKSIIILYVLLPFLRKDWFKNVKVQIVVLVSSVFVFPLFIDRLLDFVTPIVNLLGYSYYIENLDYMAEISKENASGDGLSVYMFFLIDLVIILYSGNLKKEFQKYNIISYYNIFFVGVILSRLFANNFILARTAEYFIHFRVVILSFLCFYLLVQQTSGNVLRRVVVIIIVMIMMSFFYKGIYNNAADCSPFQFVFEQ